MAPYNRRLELDATTFRRSETAIVRALRGGVQLTRPELKTVLQRAGIRIGTVQRMAHIVMHAELDAVVCSGARRGNQSTYGLFDERVPATRTLSHDDALSELVRRYFRSRGPAQIQDFVWWSGLTAADARRGLEMVGKDVVPEVIDGKTYWSRPAAAATAARPVNLLGLYDEYLIAYKDRSAALDRARWIRMVRDPFSAPIVVNGQVIGGWRRTVRERTLVVTLTPFFSLSRRDTAAVSDAALAYAQFFGFDLEISWFRSSRTG